MSADLLSRVQATKVHQVIVEIVGRLTNPELLSFAVENLSQQTRFPDINIWRPWSIGFGDAGVALSCAAVRATTPDAGIELDGFAHCAVRAGAAGITDGLAGPGLFDGLCGYAATVSILGAAGQYVRLRQQLDQFLPGVLKENACQVARSIRHRPAGYDLISGLAGWGAYLTLRVSMGRDQGAEEAKSITIWLIANLLNPKNQLQALHIPPDMLPPEQAESAPHGIIDCGISHGVAGLVALLALEGRAAGCQSKETRDALTHGAGWLASLAEAGSGESVWPRCAVATSHVGRYTPGPGSRPGWCYGDPGIARALWLAGTQLGREDFRAIALESLRTALQPESVDRLTTPTLCHGLAGLLAITLRFARETGSSDLARACRHLTDRILQQYDYESLLGYQDQEVGGGPVDNPGLLNGSAGIAVALTSTLSSDTRWQRLFLID